MHWKIRLHCFGEINRVIPQRVLVWLLASALGLPIVMCLLYALARLLEAMKDQAGADCLGRVALGLFALWLTSLVGLVVVQAINTLGNSPRAPEDEESIGRDG
jgi:hypothetical protein